MNDTASRIKQFAKEKYKTIIALEKAMGLAKGSLSSYISGRKSEPGTEIQKKLRELGCDIEWLMTGTQNPWAKVKVLPPMMNIGDSPEMMIPMMLSRVAAGEPLGGFDDVAAFFNPAKFFKSTSKLIQSTGHSMVGAGINEGDWLLIDTEAEHHNQQIVIARIGDGLTVKRLKLNGDHWLLNPENPEYSPIKIDDGTDVEILGVVAWSGRFHK